MWEQQTLLHLPFSATFNKFAIFRKMMTVRAAPVRSGMAVFRCKCERLRVSAVCAPGASYLSWCDVQSLPGGRRLWWGGRKVCTAKGKGAAAESSPTQELSPTFSGSCDQRELTRPLVFSLSLTQSLFPQLNFIYNDKNHKQTSLKCSDLIQ